MVGAVRYVGAVSGGTPDLPGVRSGGGFPDEARHAVAGERELGAGGEIVDPAVLRLWQCDARAGKDAAADGRMQTADATLPDQWAEDLPCRR